MMSGVATEGEKMKRRKPIKKAMNDIGKKNGLSMVSKVAFIFSIIYLIIAAYELMTGQTFTIGCKGTFLVNLIAAVGFTLILGLESINSSIH